MKTINKDTTPATFAQNEHVQDLAAKINKSYTSKNSVQVMVAWGNLLLALRDAADLKFVNRKGEDLTEGDPQENRLSTFKAICDEMECPSSSAYRYVDTAITVKRYPQPVQDVASPAGLNLALPHILVKFDEMCKTGTLKGKTKLQLDALSDLEARGIVLELKTAKPTKKPSTTTTSESTGLERFEEMLKDALDFARDDKLDPALELISLFGRVMKLTDRLNLEASDIRYAMTQAAVLSLTQVGYKTWQALVHQLGQDEAKAAAASAGASAAGAGADPFSSVPADAKEAGI